MDLKEYVKEVITQIAEACSEINISAGDEKEFTINSPIVNPTYVDIEDFNGHLLCIIERGKRDSLQGYTSPKKFIKITEVDFDVTLSASSKSEKGGKIDLKVLGGGMDKGNESSATNHVKFTLPVLFPSIKQPHD